MTPKTLVLFFVITMATACVEDTPHEEETIAGPRPVEEIEAPATPTLPTTRNPASWPFASDSPWNMPLGSGAIYEDESDACSNSLITGSDDAWINSEQWSHPVYQAKTTDPLVGLYKNGRLHMQIRMPSHAESALPFNTDSHLHIIDPGARYVVEMWRALPRNDGNWDVEFANKIDLYGSGVDRNVEGARAYGGSAIGGLIRKGEILNGIRHALAMAQDWNYQSPEKIVWPAWKDDGPHANYSGHVPMGQLSAIPAHIDLEALDPPLSPQALVLGKAMQDYGVYNVDSAGRKVLYAEPAAASELGEARYELPRLWAMLRCIKNNGPNSVGGGGVPRVPLAPGLSAF